MKKMSGMQKVTLYLSVCNIMEGVIFFHRPEVTVWMRAGGDVGADPCSLR